MIDEQTADNLKKVNDEKIKELNLDPLLKQKVLEFAGFAQEAGAPLTALINTLMKFDRKLGLSFSASVLGGALETSDLTTDEIIILLEDVKKSLIRVDKIGNTGKP